MARQEAKCPSGEKLSFGRMRGAHILTAATTPLNPLGNFAIMPRADVKNGINHSEDHRGHP